MSIQPAPAPTALQWLHADIEYEQDPAALLISLYRAEAELIDSVLQQELTETGIAWAALLSPAALKHWTNFLAATRDRAAHFHRLHTALDSAGKANRRALRLAPHTGSLVTSELPHWCRAAAPDTPGGSINVA